jgi:hypothetical protein
MQESGGCEALVDMGEKRISNSELRLQRLEEEDAQRDRERGILELFDDDEPRDEDAPLAREEDS